MENKDPKTGRFLPGNTAWRARSKFSTEKIFSTPADLWAGACEYFEWVEENPLYASESIKYMGDGDLMSVPKLRIMTIQSMCIFLGTPASTWYKYRDYEEYKGVCEMIEGIIYEQKLSGAAADLLNSNIISRHLGLTDKQDIEQRTKGSMKWKITFVDAAKD